MSSAAKPGITLTVEGSNKSTTLPSRTAHTTVISFYTGRMRQRTAKCCIQLT
jgi:hypothetical protein